MNLVAEVTKMNMVFAAHKVKARLQPIDPETRRQLVVITPTFILVPIKRHSTTKIAQVSALLPELRSAVSEIRRQPTAVRFTDELCGHIEIARDNPKPLLLRLEDHKTFSKVQALAPFQALVGRSYAYGGRDEVLSLTDSNEGSTFAAGMSGTGKSTFVRAYLSTMLYSTSPDKLHVYLVDMKHRSLVPYEAMPHVCAAAYDEVSAAQVIKHVYAEMEQRKNEEMPHRTLLVIDELRELKFTGGELLEMLSRIASIGRELGTSILCATQKPLASELGSIIKSQFAIRVTGTLEDANSSYIVTGRSGLNAHLLEGKGAMILVATGRQPTRIQVYNFDSDLVSRFGEMTSRRWINAPRPAKLVIKQATGAPVAPLGRADRSVGDAVKIAHIFDEYYNPTSNSLRNGAKTRFARLIVGEHAAYEGGNATRVDKAIQHLMRERSAAQ